MEVEVDLCRFIKRPVQQCLSRNSREHDGSSSFGDLHVWNFRCRAEDG